MTGPPTAGPAGPGGAVLVLPLGRELEDEVALDAGHDQAVQEEEHVAVARHQRREGLREEGLDRLAGGDPDHRREHRREQHLRPGQGAP